MKLRRTLFATGVALALLFAVFLHHQRLRAETNEREAYFLSLYGVMLMDISESKATGDRPQSLQGLFLDDNGMSRDLPMLLRPFPQGLDFKWEADGWTLEEPAPRKVSLFRTDRLVASDKDFPHWELSSQRAAK